MLLIGRSFALSNASEDSLTVNDAEQHMDEEYSELHRTPSPRGCFSFRLKFAAADSVSGLRWVVRSGWLLI